MDVIISVLDLAKENLLLIILGGVLLVVILLAMSLFITPFRRYKARGFLLTKTEVRSYKTIRPFISGLGLELMAQVRIADVLSVKGSRKSRSWWNAFKKISSKHVDFVVVDPSSFKIICAIEIDDRSHQRKDRRERDSYINKAFKAADVPLLRCVPGNEPMLKRGIENCLM